MRAADAKLAAGCLAEALQMGQTIAAIPERCRPRSTADGYQVQARLVEELGIAVGGWKIGCTSAVARKMMGARGPFAGRVLGPRIFASGAMLPASAYRFRGLEGEFAFRLARDLPPRRRAYSRAEVKAAVGALHPAVEIVDSRFTDLLKVGVPSMIADLGLNAALVLGPPVKRWATLALPAQPVRMTVNGKVVGEGTGAAVMGDPLIALAWLANLMRRRGGLAAGEIVTTGTCTGLQRGAPGDHVAALFGRDGRLGRVDLTLVA
ncbi:MAG: fumarylacetoacetate hydrolase family protein [Proteobacteria bacterium]|nr:fumarylacetoacetate hydrolase family protein [Pseudomonadota bacterium]